MTISPSISFTTLPTTKANPSIAAVTFPTKLPVSHGRRLSKASTTITSASKAHQCLADILGNLQRKLTSSSSGDHDDVQTLSVYEFNEGDRRSPAFLKLSKEPEKSLGDLVTFTNKLYSGDLTARLGITAGLIIYIERDPVGGDRYEAVYSFHFGKFGQLAVQGPYYSDMDSVLAVKGGTGVFEGATGNVRLTNVAYPFKLFYTFELKGIEKLPSELVGGAAVKPSPEVKPLIPTRR